MRTMIAMVVVFLVSAAHAQSLPKNSGDPLQDICSGFLE